MIEQVFGGDGLVADEQALVLAFTEAADAVHGVSRHRVSDLLETIGSPERLLGGLTGLEAVDLDLARRLVNALPDDAVVRWRTTLASLSESHPDVRLVTVCDDRYPVNLRQAYDRTPILFVRGDLDALGERSVAIVGTRKPSADGLEQARRLATGLARAAVTVVSGLAEGIDTAAQTATLEARGRTTAVVGHGIVTRTYPRSNIDLAERIVASGGAVVSQFWPTAPPTRQTFLMRNVTTSGLSLGTVVVEAGDTSGARQQARKCLEHGKQLFLLDGLVMHQEWAERYAQRPGVAVVRDVEEVLDRLDSLAPSGQPVQLTLG